MARLLGILILFIVLGVAIFYGWRLLRPASTPPVASPAIKVTNRPVRYCPTTAQLIVARVVQSSKVQVVFDETIPVRNCDTIPLAQPDLQRPGDFRVYVKLPKARAFQLAMTAPLVTQVTHPLQLGDVNNDNVIDQTDISLVEVGLKTKAADVDLDNDGASTVLDLSLTRLNQGIGVARPDDRAWAS